MAMSPIEIIALVLIIVFFIKMFVVFTKPRAWLKFAKSIWRNPNMLAVILLILAVIVGYYLLQELSMVQIFATAAFVSLLTGISFAPYSKDFMVFASSAFKKKDAIKKAWLAWLVWTILALWALWQILVV